MSEALSLRINTSRSSIYYPSLKPVVVNSQVNVDVDISIDPDTQEVQIALASAEALPVVNSDIGSFALASITVDQYGRVTAASSNPVFTGTVTSVVAGAGLSGGEITNSGTISLSAVNSTIGQFNYASITVDEFGRITAASSNPEHLGTVTQITAGAGLLGGSITNAGTISLPAVNSDIGDFINANISVDQFGRITAASSNSAGTVTAITAGAGLSGGTITGTGTISLPAVNSTPGDFTNPAISVDEFGRITAVNSGTTTAAWSGPAVSAIGNGLIINAGTLSAATQISSTVNAATATITPGNAQSVAITLQASTTLTIAPGYNGQNLRLKLIQDATGGRTVAFDSSVQFGSDVTSFIASTNAGATDLVQLIYDAAHTRWMFAAFNRGF